MFHRAVLAIIAVVLSVTAFALFGGKTVATPEEDGRTVIILSDAETTFIRKEMRGLLESVQDMLDAAAEGDRARLVAAARRAGMNGPEKDHIPISLAVKLPMEFKKLGLKTHREFDAIAAEAPEQGLAVFAAKRLGETMTNCTACHATFRIKAASEK